jgi:hypothetical protein
MRLLLGSVAAFGLAAGLSLPAGAQGDRCTGDSLTLDGIIVAARFCVPSGAAAPSVSVTETFRAGGKIVTKTLALAVVSDAVTSRTIDDVDLTPLGAQHSLHMTLAYRGGLVRLEHALALPGAVPVK